MASLSPFPAVYFSPAFQLLHLNWYFSIISRAGALGEWCHAAVPVCAGLRKMGRIYSLQMKQIPFFLLSLIPENRPSPSRADEGGVWCGARLSMVDPLLALCTLPWAWWWQRWCRVARGRDGGCSQTSATAAEQSGCTGTVPGLVRPKSGASKTCKNLL